MATAVDKNGTDVPWTVVHRAERSFPVLPAPATLTVQAPPEQADPDPGGGWTALLPLLGSLSALGFAVVMHNVVYLAVGVLVVTASLVATYAGRRAGNRRERRRRDRRRAAYVRHVDDLLALAATAAQAQRDALDGTHPTPARLLATARDDGALWERRRQHQDFGTVRIGLGPVDALVRLTAASTSATGAAPPDEHLAELAASAERATQTLATAPVTLALTTLASVAIIGPRATTRTMARSWISQLCAFHSPADLQVVGCASAEALAHWDWLKWLPHTIDQRVGGDELARTGRTVSSSPDDLAAQLEPLVRRPGTAPPVVVLVDGYGPGTPVARTPWLDQLLAHGHDHAVTVILLCATPSHLPADCAAQVELLPDGTCTARLAGAATSPTRGVLPDELSIDCAAALARWLAGRRPDDDGDPLGQQGPARLSDLLAATGTEAITQGPPRLRGVPIGQDDRGRPVLLNLDEPAAGGDGPHGVLVGATGSGKSELLKSFVAGLAASHPPGLLDLLLVDYKGGAAFAGLAGLPHVAGLVTNLADDPSLITRVTAALSGELERRQRVLRTTGHASVAAQQAHASEAGETGPLSSLVVVVDEFGELLSAEPGLLDTFVRIGRLGRSLGVHLLLASQRLDEGRLGGLESHLRFRVALQTFTAAESVAVLGSTVAFELPPLPGLGFLKVDGQLTRFRAALSTSPSRPPEEPVRITLVEQFTLDARRRSDPHPAVSAGAPTELDALVESLRQRYEHRARPVWTPPLPTTVDLAALPLAAVPLAPAGLAVVAGLVDVPEQQRQLPLVVDLIRDGGVIAVGAARSGRSTFLRTVVRALAAHHDATELQVYAIDLGGGGLTALIGLPHVAAVVDGHDPGGITRVLDRVHAISRERTHLLRTHGLPAFDDLVMHPSADSLLPHPTRARILLLVDHLLQLRADQPDEESRLCELATSGPALGIHLAVTAGRWLDLRPALLDGLGLRLELRLSDPVDSRFGRALAESVPRLPGRGLTATGHAFQLATVDADHPVRTSPAGHTAPALVALPTEIAEPAATGDIRAAGFPLGRADGQGQPVSLDLLAPGAHLLVYGDAGSGRSTLLARVAGWLATACPDRISLHLIDPARALLGLASSPAVAAYAYEPVGTARLVRDLGAALADRYAPAGLTPHQLAARSWWSGAEHVLVVDDYDLLVRPEGSPLTQLVDALAAAGDLGWHVVIARRVTGASRVAYDPFGQRLREQAPTGVLLSGDPGEGRLLGGVAATILPPGRARLLRPGEAEVTVQTYLPSRAR